MTDRPDRERTPRNVPDEIRCTAKSKQSGQRCLNPRLPGATVCRMHGGQARQVKAAAAERLARAAATREAARFGVPVDVDPGTALLDLVHWQAGIVAYWRDQVTRIEADGGTDALTWGTTKVKQGGDDHGETQEAKPHIAYAMLDQAQQRLAEYATATLKAGVDERRVRIAEQQGQLLANAIRNILAALHLTPDQELLVGTVVPAQLRLLTGGQIQ